jgi:hypothetical protein
MARNPALKCRAIISRPYRDEDRRGPAMKKSLLWLGPLACLALACLYAYAWFTRDPLAVAIDRFKEGVALAEAVAIVGREPDHQTETTVVNETRPGVFVFKPGPLSTMWRNELYEVRLWSEGGRVTQIHVDRAPETVLDKVHSCLCNPSSLWASKYETVGYPKKAFDPPTY